MPTYRAMRSSIFCITLSLAALLAGCGGGGGGTSSTTTQQSAPPPPVSKISVSVTRLPDAFIGTPYSQTLTATGGSGKYIWSTQGFYYPGLTFDATTATISGTPTGPSTSLFNLTVSDASNPSNSINTQIYFRALQKFAFQRTTYPNAHVNVPYFGSLLVQPAVLYFQVTSGSIPPGLSLSPMSDPNYPLALQGIATTAGSYNFTIQASSIDSPPQVLTQTVSITVDNNAGITNTTLPDGIFNAPYSAQFAATGGTPPYHWSGVNFHQGQQIDPNTGLFTETNAGAPSIQVALSDSSNPPQQDTRVFNLNTYAPITLNTPAALIIGKSVNQSIAIFNGGKPPYNVSLASGQLPPGVSLVGWNLVGTPTQIGTYPVTLNINDSANPPQSVQANLTLNVTPPILTATPSWQQQPLPVGVPFDGYIIVTGGTPPYQMRTGSGRAPSGITFDPNTGHFTGTPSQIGDFSDPVIVTDSSQPQMTARVNVDFYIIPPKHRNDSIANATPLGNTFITASISPYADPLHLSNPAPDQDYYHVIAAPGSLVNATLNSSNGTLAPVLEMLDANGNRLQTCSGNQPCLANPGLTVSYASLADQVPPGLGNNADIYLHVLDWRGDARPDMLYTLSVNGVINPLDLSLNPVETSFALNTLTAFPLNSQGASGQVTWSLQSGSLPPGIAITNSTTPALSGTPTALGTYNVVLRATDSNNPRLTATRALQIDIVNPFTINPVSLPHLKVGVPFSYQFSVSGGSGSTIFWMYAPNFQCAAPPVNDNAGFMQLTPLQAGSFQIDVTALQYSPQSNQRMTIPVTVDP